MHPMRPLMCIAPLSLGLLSACALRPYYRQVLPPDVAATKPQAAQGMGDVMLRVVAPGTGRPIPGARVLLGTSRRRVAVTSDVNGFIQMPVTPDLLAENPLVEVILPPGVHGYTFQPVKLVPESQPTSESEPQIPHG